MVWFGIAEGEKWEDCITFHIWTEICYWVVQWVAVEFLCLPELNLSNARLFTHPLTLAAAFINHNNTVAAFNIFFVFFFAASAIGIYLYKRLNSSRFGLVSKFD